MLSPWNFPRHRVSSHININNHGRHTTTRGFDAALGDTYVMALKLCIVIDLRYI
jgi:hypothetical protein